MKQKRRNIMGSGVRTRGTVSFIDGARSGEMMAAISTVAGTYHETKFFASAMELVRELNYLLCVLNIEVPDLPTLQELEMGADIGNRKMHSSREETLAVRTANERADSAHTGRSPAEMMASPKEENRRRHQENNRRMDVVLAKSLQRMPRGES
jgi:hypothetical protein